MISRQLARLRHGRRHRVGSSAAVNIHIREFSQLFNSLDPSPFWDRDLAREAAEFIEEEFSEKLSAETWNLYVHAHDSGGPPPDLQTALENYYGRMASSARRALREHLWSGEWTLVAGVVVFLLSMGIRSMLGKLLGRLPQILDEGLIILAWLALWRPAEMLLYGWMPLRRKERLYERLARIRVFVRPDAHARPPDTKIAALAQGRAPARDQPPESD
ncbi:MAG TPA: hypothetical protein VJ738_10265 [Steroidobacteraceae bacterium]|nr:hypothetical protein [Steroidobacteraceae bacterium]